jgi:hypothetical protein
MCIVPGLKIPHVGIYPKEIIQDVPKDLFSRMFSVALFIILKHWKHPKYPFSNVLRSLRKSKLHW